MRRLTFRACDRMEVTLCRRGCRRCGGAVVWFLPPLALVAVTALWWGWSAVTSNPGGGPIGVDRPGSSSPAASPVHTSAVRHPAAGGREQSDSASIIPAGSNDARDTGRVQTAENLTVAEPTDPESSGIDSRAPVSTDAVSTVSGADAEASTEQQGPDASAGSDSRHKASEFVGEWASFYQGPRQLVIKADGTGTMVSEPAGLTATLFAKKLTFNIRWRIEGDQIHFETISGEPQDKVNVVTRMYGKLRRHKVLSVKPAEIVLLDEDGVTEYVWTRKD